MEQNGLYFKTKTMWMHWIYCVPLIMIFMVPFRMWDEIMEIHLGWFVLVYAVIVIPYCLHLTRWFEIDPSGIILRTQLGKDRHYDWHEVAYVELYYTPHTMQREKKEQYATIYDKHEDWLPVRLFMEAPELKVPGSGLSVSKMQFLELMSHKGIEVRVNEALSN